MTASKFRLGFETSLLVKLELELGVQISSWVPRLCNVICRIHVRGVARVESHRTHQKERKKELILHTTLFFPRFPVPRRVFVSTRLRPRDPVNVPTRSRRPGRRASWRRPNRSRMPLESQSRMPVERVSFRVSFRAAEGLGGLKSTVLPKGAPVRSFRACCQSLRPIGEIMC